jgi:ankyrin repeat protein
VTDWHEKIGGRCGALEHGADVNARREDLSTPLHVAVAWGYFKVVRMLLQCRVDVNSRDAEGETPLHLVRKSRSGVKHLNVVQLLLERGADVNSQDKVDATVLHNASQMLNLEMARVLVDHGANLNAVNTWGQTPLHLVFKTSSHSNVRVGVA